MTDAGLMKLSSVIVGGDTGFLHLAVALGKRERRASGRTGVAPRRALRLGKRDVHVDDGPVEHPIADGAADDPGLFAGEQLFDELTNRRPPASCVRDRY